MKSLVVFLALAAVACGSLVPLAQPAHHPALVLDPHGRPLDTAEVINARALHLQAKALEHHGHAAIVAAPIAHSVVAAPAAVSHQSRVDVHSSPAVVAHVAHSSPLLSYSAHGLAGLGHLLKKRSLGHWAYAAPLAVAPAAVSHQSRVDVVSSPAVVSHAVAPVISHAVPAPVLAHAIAPTAVSHQSRVDVVSSPAVVSHAVAPVISHAVAAPVLAHAIAPAAVSHQSRVDVHSSPAVVAHVAHAAPLLSYSAHGLAGLGHLLKKRSLGHWAYSAPLAIAPAAVSHQSRVDVVSSPAVVSHEVAPVISHAVAAPVVAHAIAPAAVSHQSRVDVHSSPAVVAYGVVAAAPHVHAAPLAHSANLLHAAPWAHGAAHLVHSW